MSERNKAERKLKQQSFSEDQQRLLKDSLVYKIIRLAKPTILRDGRLSPYYIDLRNSLTDENPQLLPIYAKAMVDKIVAASSRSHARQTLIGIPDAGTALAAATCVTGISAGHDFSHLTLRKVPKDYGFDRLQGRLVIGEPALNREYNLIDDVITSSASKVETITTLEREGFSVKRVFVWFDLEQGGKEKLLTAKDVEFHPIFCIRDVFNFYLETGLMTRSEYDRLTSWLQNERASQNLT